MFPDPKITNTTSLHDTPSGDTDIVSLNWRVNRSWLFQPARFFKFNPSVSFIVNFDPSRDKNARENINVLWDNLFKGWRSAYAISAIPVQRALRLGTGQNTAFRGNSFYQIPKAKRDR